MGLTFDGLTIPGIVEPWAAGEWALASQFHSQFGLLGAGVLDGGRTMRVLTVPIWLKNSFSNYSDLTNLIASIEAKIGRLATLAESSGITATYPLCYFELVKPREPVLPPNPSTGWSQKFTLQWRQLSP